MRVGQVRFFNGQYGLKVLRDSGDDVATVVAAGVTLFEALKAYDHLKAAGTSVRIIDLYSVAPVDKAALVAAGRATGGRLITVEDHYAAGGLGDAVAEAVADAHLTVHRLAVREVPRSGKPDELLADHLRRPREEAVGVRIVDSRSPT